MFFMPFLYQELFLSVMPVPGRLNVISISFPRPRVFYRQCSELCRVGHSYFRTLSRLVYTLQPVSRILLSLRYYASVGTNPFTSVEVIIREVDFRFIVRRIHLVRSQSILLLIYMHILRSFYYRRRANLPMSLQRAVILLITIRAAFLRYVLPWRQISFWRATVITRFLRVLPYRQDILELVWGRFTVGHPTLTRFFSLHYLLSLLIAPLSLIYIIILHMQRSRRPIEQNDYYLPFWPYFRV